MAKTLNPTLELLLKRNQPHTKDYTAGKLYIDGVFGFFTLEDEVREVTGKPVSEWKIPKVTAIPRGRYRVVMTKSPRFGRVLPEILNVPGYVGVRIHRGNLAQHTEGCLLVGNSDGNDKDAWLGHSGDAEKALCVILKNAINLGQQVWLTVQ